MPDVIALSIPFIVSWSVIAIVVSVAFDALVTISSGVSVPSE